MRYKIGKAAKIFGVTPQAIRFYEKEHLLPDKDPCATRYYTAREFKRVTSIRRYMEMGFGTREIREMFDTDNVTALTKRVRDKKLEVYDQIMRLQRTIYALDLYEEGLHLIDKLLDRYELTENPPLLLFTNQLGQTLIEGEAVEAQVQQWSPQLDIVSSATIIPAGLLNDPASDLQRDSGFCIAEKTARVFDLPYDPAAVRLIPSTLCLHTVIRVHAPDISLAECAPGLFAYVREMGLRFAGDAVGISLCITNEGSDDPARYPRHVYYELWIPVEKSTAV